MSALKFLKQKISSNPFKVDRLIVSSYIQVNNLSIRKNLFLQEYIILESDKNEFNTLREFVSLIEQDSIFFDLEKVIELFEFVISPSDRVVSGAVYTPKEIRDHIIDESFAKFSSWDDAIKIADISSGCGGFLFTAAVKVKQQTNKTFAEIFNKNIYGLDIQGYSITRTKILLTLLAITNSEDLTEFNFNLFEGDALDFDWHNQIPRFNGFSILLGNPPYVCSRNINSKTKKLIYKWEVSKTGHPDLYIPFFQIGIELLKENGILGYITMNSFFKSLNGRALREYFQNKRYKIKILDFGTAQVFRSRNTYTCICMIENIHSDKVYYTKSEGINLKSKKPYKSILYTDLNFYKGWNLQNSRLINKIESTGTPFGELYTTRNGIATLKNNIYIFSPIDEDKSFYYLDNGSTYKIEKTLCKDIVNPNKLSSSPDLRKLKEKIIFPYEFIEGRARIYSEAHLERNYPNALRYLQSKKDILASRDKGKGEYEKWFAYGRNQSLEKMKFKLFFPHITDKIPNYALNSDEDLLFYNGIAVVGRSIKQLAILRKLMASRLFWFYITNSSKPYSSTYYSLSKNYIRNFGVYKFDADDIEFITKETNAEKLDVFFEDKYEVSIS